MTNPNETALSKAKDMIKFWNSFDNGTDYGEKGIKKQQKDKFQHWIDFLFDYECREKKSCSLDMDGYKPGFDFNNDSSRLWVYSDKCNI